MTLGRMCALVALLLVAACGPKERVDELTHESVRHCAEEYYTMLLEGQYDEFVGGMAHADSMPHDFRSQLEDMVAQTAHRQQGMHGGMVRVVATADSLRDSTAFVFLDIVYADSVREQIGVPMVMLHRRWRMK